MNKKKTELTDLEWFIYTLLEEETLGTTKSLTQREIYEACKAVGFKVSWNESQNQHNDHCRWLNTAIDHLTSSLETDKIIDHHAYRYFLCTREQAIAKRDVYKLKIQRASKRMKQINTKMKRHDQGKLLSNRGYVIDAKSKAKKYYETYNIIKESENNEATI